MQAVLSQSLNPSYIHVCITILNKMLICCMKLGYHTLFVVILLKFLLKLGIADHHKYHSVGGPTKVRIVCQHLSSILPVYIHCMQNNAYKPCQTTGFTSTRGSAGSLGQGGWADNYCLMVKY